MENIIEISNLNYNINDDVLFDNLSLFIKKNSFTTIIGKNNCGKSILSKILVGLIFDDFDIKINKLKLSQKNLLKIRKIIKYFPDDIENSFLMDTVLDEVLLSNPNISEKEIEELFDIFDLSKNKFDNPRNLSGGQKQILFMISILVSKPKIIVLDDSFSMVDNLKKDRILKKLKKYSKERNITVINITNDPEDIIYSDDVAILDNKKIIINDTKEIVLANENLFRKTGIDLPFNADLSHKLKYYNLLDYVELKMDRIINKIWK